MQMFRRLLAALVVLALSGCAMGGAPASPTSPPTTAAKATAKPTAEPTEEATEEPTAKPTTKPKATEKPSSGGSAGEIPAPPESEPYVKGTDPTIDIALATVEQGINDGDINFSDTQFYISTATVDDVEAFYDDELPGAGFDGPKQSQDQDIGKVFGYPSSDASKVAVIGAFDLQAAGIEGLVIITTVGEPKSGSGSGATPTEESGSGSGSVSSDLGDIPSPPDSTPYQEGDDGFIDGFLETFTASVTEGFEASGATSKGQATFTSTAKADEIKTFYDKEMADLGWTAQEPTPNDSAQILNYVKIDGATAEIAVVMSVDMAEIGAGDDTLVIVLLAGVE